MSMEQFKLYVSSMLTKQFLVALSFVSVWAVFTALFTYPAILIAASIGGWHIGSWCSTLAESILEDKKN